MRLSNSLRKGIIETTVGGILNRFKARRRRDTLFLEKIIVEYVTTCEQHGHGKDLRKLSERWGELAIQELTHATFKKIPPPLFSNTIWRKNWTNLGIVDDIHLDEKDDIIYLTTKNESITRIIGKNDFMTGFFNGVISALYDSQSEVIDAAQTKESCKYKFKLTYEPINTIGKDKALYDKLNYLEPIDGFRLNDAFRKGILQLRGGNKIYFREKRITITENTIFHLVGNANLLLDELPKISYDFFSKVVEKESTNEQKITLLKNLLQIMGWGIVTIVVKDKNKISIEIKNPPYGLQPEKDNWHFLNRTILGYLWLLDREFGIADVKEDYKNLKVTYLSK